MNSDKRKAVPLLGLAALGLAAAFPLAAQAQTVNITLTGHLTSVDPSFGPGAAYDSTVAVGTPFTYSFFAVKNDPQTTPVNSPGFFFGNTYDSNGPTFGGTATFGDVTLTPDATTANYLYKYVGTGPGSSDSQGQESEFGAATGLAPGFTPYFSSVQASGPGGSVSPNVTDPTADWLLGKYATDFNFTNAALNTTTGDETFLYGTVDSITLKASPAIAVPEPAPLPLLLLGLLGLGVLVRKRRASV